MIGHNRNKQKRWIRHLISSIQRVNMNTKEERAAALKRVSAMVIKPKSTKAAPAPQRQPPPIQVGQRTGQAKRQYTIKERLFFNIYFEGR